MLYCEVIHFPASGRIYAPMFFYINKINDFGLITKYPIVVYIFLKKYLHYQP